MLTAKPVLHRSPRAGRRPSRRGSLAALAASVTFGLAAAGHAAQPGACEVSRIVARALPATVNITVVKVVRAEKGDGDQTDLSGAEHLEVAYGSGAIVNPDGTIVTNKHVIKDAAHIWVTFADKSQVDAQLVGACSIVDLAVLKVRTSAPLPALKFADSDGLQVGQSVIAVGNPLGLGTSVSTGVVSALNRDLMRSPLDDYVQTDATINPGNSGGPLLNCDGNIVGIDTALVSNNKLLGSIGLGFALPSRDVEFVTHAILTSETASPTWVGLQLQDLTAQLAHRFGRPNSSGAIVTGVEANSPAARAGIEQGDIIVSVDGQDQSDARATLRTIVTLPQGQPITLAVWRHGQTSNDVVTGMPWPHLVELHSEVLASAASVARAQSRGIGLHLAALPQAERQRLGIPAGEGILIDEVTPGSQAETMGLKSGEVIERIDDHAARSINEVALNYQRRDPAIGDMQALLVRDGDSSRWVTLFDGHVDVADLLAAPVPGGPGGAREAAAAAAATGALSRATPSPGAGSVGAASTGMGQAHDAEAVGR